MIKTKTVETVEEFDENGKMTRKTVTETEETDDSPVRYQYTTIPYCPNYRIDATGYSPDISPYPSGVTITCANGK